MGKFFNHYSLIARSVSRITLMSVAPNPGTTRSGIGVTTWTWSATSRYGWSGFVRDARLPMLRRCHVQSYNQEEAVLEAKRRVDALLLV